MTTISMVLALSGLCIVLGFIALLSQKVYRIEGPDGQTTATRVEVPLFGKYGKMTTNYPALLFVVAGFALAVFALKSDPGPPPGKEAWLITGELAASDGEAPLPWHEGSLTVFPTDFEARVFPSGKFEIMARIPADQTFEDVVQRIDFSHETGSVQLFPKEELDKFVAGETSLLENRTKTSRDFRKIPVTIFQSP
ncbi:MAG: hypothetical protein ACLFRG_10330 [Desulfococcaceae bacterium]